jgi:hypothetical protein
VLEALPEKARRDAEALARAKGLGAAIDGWEPDVPLLRGLLL